MLLSVIVPTRNRADLLLRCLKHLQQQSCRTMEVLVLDDGSDAANRQALRAAWCQLDTRFRLIEVAPTDAVTSSGPSAVRNHGLSQASGALLAFCDDDDLWTDSKHAERLIQLFTARPELELFIGNQRAVHVDGRISDDWLPGLTSICSGLPELVAEIYTITTEQLCRSGGFGHMNMLTLRKTLLDRMGDGFWSRVSYEEDRDFFWRATDAAQSIAFSPRVVCQHHVPDPSRRVNVSTSFSQQERWLVAAMVSQHIAVTVKSPAITQLCLAHEGDLLRRLALHCASHNQPAACLGFARQALGARFSFKWAAYCGWAWLKSFKRG